MGVKTEEFLYLLFWGWDRLSHPTVRNLTDSFETWADRNGLLRQIQRLERRRWIDQQTTVAGERVYRLTAEGRLRALGGRDPVSCWDRAWDGVWRMVVFDVPEKERDQRLRLRRFLKARGFGLLQRSVWITPHPLDEEKSLLRGADVAAGCLTVFEARPGAHESTQDLIATAWDFERINEYYRRHDRVLVEHPRRVIQDESVAVTYLEWLRRERLAWLQAMGRDPLLPESIQPADYQGRAVWRRRLGVLAEVMDRIREHDLFGRWQ